jgi:hypothetical protein
MSILMKLILLLSLVVLSLATAKTHGIQNVKFDILSGQGSVIDTIDSSSTSIDLRGTTTVKVRWGWSIFDSSQLHDQERLWGRVICLMLMPICKFHI